MDAELWKVDFSLVMREVNGVYACVPAIDGVMYVRGTDIFDVLKKARELLHTFGYDHITINGADHGFTSGKNFDIYEGNHE